MTDEQLLARAAGGSFEDFEVLVGRLQGRVFGLARRMTGNHADAEDVTQQTFLSLIEHITSFRGDASVATWVQRIATNHALKLLRKKRGLTTVPWSETHDEDSYATLPHPDYIAQWNESPESLAERAEIRERVELALQALDDKYRLVFVLRDIEGISIKETAEILGLSEANVKVRLLRARLMLREHLTQAFGDEATRVSHVHPES
ncbi:MAG TPA: sigma-70 family RNA polymerase sigma factor [Pirellulaceae bacterium]|nr:sigma-70 family RNA polymerase sigma factor [Pirellulaceae bacterium]